jgi:hypothetical protein
MLHCWLQAQGRRVLAAQVDDSETGDDEIKQMMSGLDLSAARILLLGQGQGPPQKGLLWLEQEDVAPEWGQMSPGLVVLVARKTLVRTHFHLVSGRHVAFWLHQLALAFIALSGCSKSHAASTIHRTLRNIASSCVCR